MRNMSFSATTEQIRNRSKTVTRRTGWADLQEGTLLCAIEKGQGLKKGECVNRLAVIRVTDVRRERVTDFLQLSPGQQRHELACEGFPGMSALEFVALLQRLNRGKPLTLVTRIEFEYSDLPLPGGAS